MILLGTTLLNRYPVSARTFRDCCGARNIDKESALYSVYLIMTIGFLYA